MSCTCTNVPSMLVMRQCARAGSFAMRCGTLIGSRSLQISAKPAYVNSAWSRDASVSRTTSVVFTRVFEMPITTTCILAMSTVLKTREVGIYLVYVTVLRHIGLVPYKDSCK